MKMQYLLHSTSSFLRVWDVKCMCLFLHTWQCVLARFQSDEQRLRTRWPLIALQNVILMTNLLELISLWNVSSTSLKLAQYSATTLNLHEHLGSVMIYDGGGGGGDNDMECN